MFPFQNLEVYKKAYQSNQSIYRFLKTAALIPQYIKNQLGRASLSVMLNIAEGSAKFSDRDRKNFFITARGSAFECSALITFLFDEGDLNEHLKIHLDMTYEEISKMLFIMIKNLEQK